MLPSPLSSSALVGAKTAELPGRPSATNIDVLPDVIAHRGFKGDGLSGNTMPSFQRALDEGASCIEFDVRRTRDGVLVVHHDENLDGPFSKPISRMDYGKAAREGAKKLPPTFSEVIDFAMKNNLDMTIELKASGFEQQAIAALGDLSLNRFQLMSFDDDVVKNVEKINPAITTGLLFYELPLARFARKKFKPDFPVRQAAKAGADFIGIHKAMVHNALLDAAAGANIPVAVWTVDEAKDMGRLLADPRIDAVITNRFDRAKQVNLPEWREPLIS